LWFADRCPAGDFGHRASPLDSHQRPRCRHSARVWLRRRYGTRNAWLPPGVVFFWGLAESLRGWPRGGFVDASRPAGLRGCGCRSREGLRARLERRRGSCRRMPRGTPGRSPCSEHGRIRSRIAALEIAAEFLLNVARHWPLGGFPPGEPALEVLRNRSVERRLLWAASRGKPYDRSDHGRTGRRTAQGTSRTPPAGRSGSPPASGTLTSNPRARRRSRSWPSTFFSWPDNPCRSTTIFPIFDA